MIKAVEEIDTHTEAGCTSLLNLWYLSDNQSKMAPVVPFLIDWVEFRQEYLPVSLWYKLIHGDFSRSLTYLSIHCLLHYHS